MGMDVPHQKSLSERRIPTHRNHSLRSAMACMPLDNFVRLELYKAALVIRGAVKHWFSVFFLHSYRQPMMSV